MSKFINFHVIISHPPACLNRDDMNLQKTAVFGGAKRSRVSSQSMKKAFRESDIFKEKLGESSIRTREYEDLIVLLKQNLNYDEDILLKAVELINGNVPKSEKDKEKKRFQVVAPWTIAEVKYICEILKDKDLEDKDLLKNISKGLKDRGLLSLSNREALDIALFGRMSTSGLLTSVDASFSLAHAITTHRVESEVDWFVASDDLVENTNSARGAAHINSQSFDAGVFYRYGVLDVEQLKKNIEGLDLDVVTTMATALFEMMMKVVPSGKQHSFAAYNLADFCLLSAGDQQPISLANAFEEPIKSTSGYAKKSVDELLSHWEELKLGYELEDDVRVYDPRNFVKESHSLAEIKQWIQEKVS